jgi:hypothetical protein
MITQEEKEGGEGEGRKDLSSSFEGTTVLKKSFRTSYFC